jgi:hypothetical protein
MAKSATLDKTIAKNTRTVLFIFWARIPTGTLTVVEIRVLTPRIEPIRTRLSSAFLA